MLLPIDAKIKTFDKLIDEDICISIRYNMGGWVHFMLLIHIIIQEVDKTESPRRVSRF